MMEKIGNWIFPLKFGFGIGYGIGRKYRPIWVSVLDLNQNSGFGPTLPVRDMFSRIPNLRIFFPKNFIFCFKLCSVSFFLKINS
jgi:hypothetical protein